MKNEELLARIIDDGEFLKQYFGEKFKSQYALQAIVELHYQQNEGGYCDICPDFEYPCKTIQAIEKELL